MSGSSLDTSNYITYIQPGRHNIAKWHAPYLFLDRKGGMFHGDIAMAILRPRLTVLRITPSSFLVLGCVVLMPRVVSDKWNLATLWNS